MAWRTTATSLLLLLALAPADPTARRTSRTRCLTARRGGALSSTARWGRYSRTRASSSRSGPGCSQRRRLRYVRCFLVDLSEEDQSSHCSLPFSELRQQSEDLFQVGDSHNSPPLPGGCAQGGIPGRRLKKTRPFLCIIINPLSIYCIQSHQVTTEVFPSEMGEGEVPWWVWLLAAIIALLLLLLIIFCLYKVWILYFASSFATS